MLKMVERDHEQSDVLVLSIFGGLLVKSNPAELVPVTGAKELFVLAPTQPSPQPSRAWLLLWAGKMGERSKEGKKSKTLFQIESISALFTSECFSFSPKFNKRFVVVVGKEIQLKYKK